MVTPREGGWLGLDVPSPHAILLLPRMTPLSHLPVSKTDFVAFMLVL